MKTWCPFCSDKNLCEKEECTYCFNKSFSSFERARDWDNEKNSLIPRQVFKKSNKKYWFKCDKCSHSFEISPNHLSRKNISGIYRWCPYCSNKKICPEECSVCFDKSFASHPKSIFWSKKNKVAPRDIFKRTHEKYWFGCEKCKKDFNATLHNIVGQESWCPYCRESRGEKKVAEELDNRKIPYERQKTFKGLKNKRRLRYDFILFLGEKDV
jgi:hypothetical protein